jgi:anti-sigma regulatory factor (Ser/Thr protein kinase)
MTTQQTSAPPSQSAYNLRLRVPPDPQFSATVRSAIEGFAKLHGVTAYDLEPLICAVGEALANAIEHAASDRDIEVEAEIGADRIVAIVTDHGCGLPAIPNESAPLPRMLVERGRGIPIMQRCTHLFEVTSAPGNGTSIRLGRRRTARRKEEPAIW